MKKFAAFVIAVSFALTLSGPNAQAQSKSFEGTVTWNMTIPQLGDDTLPMTMNIKGDKIEQEMSLGPQGMVKTYIVTENNQVKRYMVMESMKMGMVQDVKAEGSNDSLVKTGKSATVAGHHADEYIIKSNGANISVWATSEMPRDLQESIASALKNQSQGSSSAFRELASKGLVPVKMEVTQNGEVAMSMELVSFEQKSLPDSLFVPPTDITYRPMPTGMGGGGMH